MRRVAAYIFAFLTLLTLKFIWGQSSLPREQSAAESGSIVDFLKPILDPHNRFSEDQFDHFVRKTAHFMEFAVLGFMICGHAHCVKWKHGTLKHILPALFGLCAAAIDETIQIFSPERGPGVKDVILDFCGALFGIFAFYIIYSVFAKITRGRTKQ